MVATRLFTYNAYSQRRFQIRAAVDADTLVINGEQNTSPGGEINQATTGKTRLDGRAIGLQARKVRIRYVSQRPAGYADWTVLIPVFRPNRWDDYTIGQRGTFRGEDVIVVGRIPQKLN